MTSHATANDADWIGRAPSRSNVTIALFLGVTALLIAGLQPIVLGTLAREGRLNATQIGLAATVELLALGISSALAGALLKPQRLRAIASVAALVHFVATLASMAGSGAQIILARTVAGLAAGVLLWITIGLIARARNAERWSGIFLTVQALAQLAFAAVLPVAVIPRFGANAALACLAAVSLLTALAAVLGPGSYEELPKTQRASIGLPIPALAGLVAVFLYMAFIVAVWVYLEPIALQAGISPQTAGMAVAVALACQVAGGTAAAVVGARLPFHSVLLGVGVINLALLGVLAASPDVVVFVACTAAFGFLWIFVMPFQVRLLIDADPSRRAALLLAGAQLLGSSAGPFIASFLVSEADVHNVLAMGAFCIVASLAIVTAIRIRAVRGEPAAAATSNALN